MGMSPRLLRPRQTGFNPRSIPGLKVWYDAAKTSSLTFNGSTVSQINDLSGNGFHAKQDVSNNQPTYLSSGINSLPTLQHDTNDSLFSTATANDVVGNASVSPAITIFIVANSTSPNAGLSVGCEPAANGRLVAYLPFDNASPNAYWDVAGTAGGRLPFTISTGQRAAGIYAFQRSGASMFVRRNGVELAAKADASQTFSSTSSVFGIGQVTFTGFSGQWSQCLVYSSAMSLAQVQAVERYLSSLSKVSL